MAAAHPFGAFVRYRFKRIGCVRRIKVKEILLCLYTVHFETVVHLKLNLNVISILNSYLS